MMADSNHMKIQDDHKIYTETETAASLQKASHTLDLLDYMGKEQTKAEEGNHQTESNELERQTKLKKLPDEVCIQNDDDSSSDKKINCDNERFGDVLRKIKAFTAEAKEKHDKNILIDAWQIFNDFFTLMEKSETNFTEEDALEIEDDLKLFLDTVYFIPDNDLSHAETSCK
jgi:hypothetical protein